MKKSELLLPAGSLVKLKTALLYGADAVYAGTPDMSLRTQSKFSLEELEEGIRIVHEVGKKIYLTLNLYIHNEEGKKLPQFVETLRRLKPDGVLMADPGVFYYLKEHAPELNRFVSTQANICSSQTVKFWQSMGAKLCVLGREVTFSEMEEIRKECPDVELECFMHGAMCMSYSGRCLISNFMADRSANRGKCAHCCRWHYKLHIKMKDGSVRELVIDDTNKDNFEYLLEEDFRPGELYEVVEDEHGSYLLNSKDIKIGDLIAYTGHIAMIVGINNNDIYIAESLPHLKGVVTKKYTKEQAKNTFTHIILLDNLYKKEGKLTNMWY